MEDSLITLLETFKYPVMRQGSLAKNQEYPATFITFWNNDESAQSFYDNKTASVVYDYSINVYSTSPNTTYSLLDSIRLALLQAGWIITDRGYDVASDEITHTGRGLEAEFLQMQNL